MTNKTARQERLTRLRWEGWAEILKMLGTLGTVGILAKILGKYACFSSVPKSANGTLETNADVGGRSQ